MPDLKSMPPEYQPGARQLSTTSLNEILSALFRQIVGDGKNIQVNKFGNRIVISYTDTRNQPPGGVGTSLTVEDTYDPPLVIPGVKTIIINIQSGLRIDQPDSSQPVPPPSVPSLSTSPTGGTIAAGVYYVMITYINPTGETVPSAFSVITTTGGTSTVTIAFPSASATVTGWRVYTSMVSIGPYSLQGGTNSMNLDVTLTSIGSGTTPPTVTTAIRTLSNDRVTVSGIPAATEQQGMVSLLDQYMGSGQKFFNNTVYVNASGFDSNSERLGPPHVYAVPIFQVNGRGLQTVLMDPPPAPALSTSNTGGVIQAGTYYAVLTYTDSSTGETVASPSSNIVTFGMTSTIFISSPSTGTIGVAGYKVYVSTYENGIYHLQGGVHSIGTAVTLNSISSTGNSPPEDGTAYTHVGTGIPIISASDDPIGGSGVGTFAVGMGCSPQQTWGLTVAGKAQANFLYSGSGVTAENGEFVGNSGAALRDSVGGASIRCTQHNAPDGHGGTILKPIVYFTPSPPGPAESFTSIQEDGIHCSGVYWIGGIPGWTGTLQYIKYVGGTNRFQAILLQVTGGIITSPPLDFGPPFA